MDAIMKTIAMVVILYGKRFEESKTLQSLMRFSHQLDQLLIVNNGPESLDSHDSFFIALSKKHKHVEFENQIQNKPLSWIYNDFIRKYNADRYVIFDDDTIIPIEYCEKILFDTGCYDLGLPSIKSSHDNKIYYPVINSRCKEVLEKYYQYSKGTYSIGSGIVISNDLKKQMLKEFDGVFDHHFALYGVDISLFRRLDKLKNSGKIVINTRAELFHYLSKFDNEISDFRRKELLIDQMLQFRWYKVNKKQVIRMILGMVVRLRISELGLVLKTFIKGKHPRC